MSNKTNINIKREKSTTWTYVFWLMFGGFITIGLVFLMGAILTASIVGILMSTQVFKLANYFLNGADIELVPNFEADKVKNIIWAILIGWFLYLLHMFFAGFFYITYVGRGISKMWSSTAKLVLMPFGIEIKI